MAVVNPSLSIIILNINKLNTSFKRHRVAEWILKIKIQQYAVYKKTQGTSKDTHRLKGKGWKNIFHVNWNKKRPGVTILT